jgi:hypothetical protein
VAEKDRANFCDYFRPSSRDVAGDGASKAAEARDKLNGLFDDG